jgi:hypothetical protein
MRTNTSTAETATTIPRMTPASAMPNARPRIRSKETVTAQVNGTGVEPLPIGCMPTYNARNTANCGPAWDSAK